MFANFLIGLREGLEAALIVSILLAHVVRVGRAELARYLWIGTGSAIAAAFGFGALLEITSAELSDSAEELFAGSMGVITVALITWMIFWMAKRSRYLKQHLEGEVDSAMAGNPWTLGLIAFVAVIREGLETALFLWTGIKSTVAGDDRTPFVGATLGLLAAVALGVALYRGALTVDLRKLFRWSGAALIVVAAGVLAYAVHDLQEFGLLPGEAAIAYDVSAVISEDGWLGTLLRGIFSFRPVASWLEVAAWWCYFVPTFSWFLRLGSNRRQKVAVAA